LKLVVLALLLVAAPAFAFDYLLSGSGALDYRYVSGPTPPANPSPLGINGMTFEVAQKVVVDVGNGVSFSVKACGGCHGLEVDQAYGELHVKRWFNLRAGRLNVPVGEFTLRHDPANFTTPSKPLPYAMGDMLNYTPAGFNLGIVPAPYVDNGAELFGSLALGKTHQLDYSLCVVKGLAGDNDLDFARSRNYVDNNRTPAFGGRLVLTGDDWAVGASGTAGTYDPKDSLWYLIGGLELYARFGPVILRAEAIGRRTALDRTATGYPFQLVDPWFLKVGWYLQLDFQVHRLVTIVARSDGLHRFGEPLPGSELTSTSAGVQRQTLAILVRANDNVAIKADYELWTFSGTDYPTRHLARVGLVLGY
jgi:hypothetical protein